MYMVALQISYLYSSYRYCIYMYISLRGTWVLLGDLWPPYALSHFK